MQLIRPARGTSWALLAALLAGAGFAYVPDASSPQAGAAPTPAESRGTWSQWTHLSELSSRSLDWARFETVMGTDWQVAIDSLTGLPAWIIGPGLRLGRPVGVDDGTIALARAIVERLQGALGVEDLSALVLDRAVASLNPSGQEIVGIQFRQTHHGYDVRTSNGSVRVHLTFNGTLGVLAALGTELIAGLDVPVANPLPIGEVIAAAMARVPAPATAAARLLSTGTYVYVRPVAEAQRSDLVHEVQVQTDHPPRQLVLIFDARSGALLEERDDLRTTDVIGNFSAGTWDDSPPETFTVRPMRLARVTVQGGNNALTNTTNGDFQIAHGGTDPVTITGGFSGQWSNVIDNSGNGNLTFSQPATPGTPAAVVLNPTAGVEFETAEATAFRFTTETHLFAQRRIPGFNGFPALTTNVNLTNTCNAFWNGSSINFFRFGGGCNNTAYEEVVAHEFGHGFHSWFHGSTNPGGFSEGIGDHLGILVASRDDAGNAIATQRAMGRNFRTTGAVVRDYRPGGGANNTQWPCTGCEVHKAGEVWGGFICDLRDNLIASLGLAPAAETCEIITIAQYTRNPANMDSGVMGTFLQDDNDGNLLNGTPNFRDIALAADRHALPRPPDPQNLSFGHVSLPWTQDTTNAYEIRATVTSSAGTVTSVTLNYSLNGGGNLTLPMSASGNPNEWRAGLPAQPAGTAVSYNFRGIDSAMNNELSVSFAFRVSRPGVSINETFETGAAGWVASGTPTLGPWELGDPEGTLNGATPFQLEDDHTPPPGVNCFTTGRLRGTSYSANDLDGGPVTLTSPVYDLSSASSATFSFWYVFNLATAINDQLRAEVSNNAGGAWTPAVVVTTAANTWRQASVAVPIPLTNQMQVRFIDSDNPNDSVNEGMIDDVSLSSIDTVNVLTTNSATPQIGQPLTYSLAAPGLPGSAYVLGISLFTGPTFIAGIGTFDLGAPITPLAIAALDGAGNGGVTIGIPALPPLVGITVHAQAYLQGSPNLITNRATITFAP